MGVARVIILLMVDYLKFENELASLEAEYDYDQDGVYYYNVHRPSWLIRELQRRYNSFDYSLIPEIIRYALNEKVVNYRYTDHAGTGHLIIFVELGGKKNVVLRINPIESIIEKYMSFERDFADMYKKVSIPSSTILWSDISRKHFNFDIQIMEVLPGASLYEFDGTESDYGKIAFQLGQMVAREYKVPMKGKGWGRITKNKRGQYVGTFNSPIQFLTAYLEHDLRILTLFGMIDPQGMNRIKEFFMSDRVARLFTQQSYGYLVHNDPSDHNIRYEGTEVVAIFDWENAVIFDPVCELGTAPTWTSAYPKKEKMIEGFVHELGYTPVGLEEKMAVCYLRKAIDKAQFALRGQRLAAKHVANFRNGVKLNQLTVEVTDLLSE